MMKSAAMAIFALGASAASAATFDFTAAAGDQATLDFLVDGVALSVSASSFDEAGTFRVGDDSVLTQSAEGLGARNTVADPVMEAENNTFVDGRSVRDVNDVVLFDFGQTVTVDEIVFAVREGAEFAATQVSFFLPSGGGSFVLSGAQAIGAFGFPGAVSSFGLGALGADDQFKIASITVSVVPLPAAAPLMLAGLGGLVALRRRKG